MRKDSFIFYKSFYDAIHKLNDKELKADIFESICELALNENDIELDNSVGAIIMELIKPQIIANNKRYKDGCKGGCPKGTKKPSMIGNQNAKKQPPVLKKQNQNKTKTKANENENENENDNVNVNNNIINNIVDYLNQLAETNFKSTTKETQNFLNALLKDYSEEEIKETIKKMVDKWKNTKMEDYLRPSTLFRKSNFDEYYGLKEGRFKTQQEKNRDVFARMRKELEDGEKESN